jgi:hypothetical protein
VKVCPSFLCPQSDNECLSMIINERVMVLLF